MKAIFIYLIKFYQKYLSGLKRSHCPYYPCCSKYALEALDKHGAFWGLVFVFLRLIRCNPFSRGGLDPVPEVIDFQLFRNYWLLKMPRAFRNKKNQYTAMRPLSQEKIKS